MKNKVFTVRIFTGKSVRIIFAEKLKTYFIELNDLKKPFELNKKDIPEKYQNRLNYIGIKKAGVVKKLAGVAEEDLEIIKNFLNMVGSTSGWADIKRKQREKEKLLKQSGDVDNVHHDVHSNVHIEIRDKRLEYRDNNKEIKSIDHNDSNDKNDNNDKVTLASDSLNINSIQNLMINEWHNTFKDSHVFTKYLVYSKYLEEGNVEALISANSFFESYLDKYYDFNDLKNHVQYFLFQYRKLSKAERNRITNRMGYLTNAIKRNQRTLEWKASDEFKQLQKVETIAGKRLKKDAQIYFPNDPVRQELYYDKYFFTYIGEETKKIRTEFNKKCSVK